MSESIYRFKIALMSETEYKSYSKFVESSEALAQSQQYWKFLYTAIYRSVEHSDVTHLVRAMVGASSLGYVRDTRTVLGAKYLKVTSIWPSEKISHPITGKEIQSFKAGQKLTVKAKDRLAQLKANGCSLVTEIFQAFLDGREIERDRKGKKPFDFLKALERISTNDETPLLVSSRILELINELKSIPAAQVSTDGGATAIPNVH